MKWNQIESESRGFHGPNVEPCDAAKLLRAAREIWPDQNDMYLVTRIKITSKRLTDTYYEV